MGKCEEIKKIEQRVERQLNEAEIEDRKPQKSVQEESKLVKRLN